MSVAALSSNLLLGTGGERPGLWAIGEDGQAVLLAELDRGHSVYSVAVDAEGGCAAAGTRGGRIIVLRWDRPDSDLPDFGRLDLYQGEGLLSVCLLGDGLLAASDTGGRCLLWDLGGQGHPPTPLPSGGRLVCSLLQVGQGRMLGLASDGHLLQWDIAAGSLLSTSRVPEPAPHSR